MREINGLTATCGLIGNPVEHTVSPVIHNALAEATGVNLAYLPFHVETGKLEAAVTGAYALNVLGLNITVPYKTEVISYLKEVDALAERIGAVNTLVRTAEGYKGYNTDMPGLFRAMSSDGVHIAGEKVILLGAGGVARAVAILLMEKGAEQLYIVNRTKEKAQQIADEVNALCGRAFAQAVALADYKCISGKQKYLCIQTTNVGMYPKSEEAVIEDEDFYQMIHTGYDLIYNPYCTKFMELVQNQGGRAYNGLKMLLYQGIIAYELWTGKEINGELADNVLQRLLTVMGQK